MLFVWSGYPFPLLSTLSVVVGKLSISTEASFMGEYTIALPRLSTNTILRANNTLPPCPLVLAMDMCHPNGFSYAYGFSWWMGFEVDVTRGNR